jgi:hypothetical protein
VNAAECLLAASRCRSDYRGLLVSIAGFWLALARHDEAIEAWMLRGVKAPMPNPTSVGFSADRTYHQCIEPA